VGCLVPGRSTQFPISVNHACMLTNIVVCPVSFVHTWEGEAQLILKIIVEVQRADLRRFDKHKKRATLWTLKIFVEAQGADLRRFDKHKKRATLGTGEYPPVMNCTLFAVHKALKYEWVIIPCHLMLGWQCRQMCLSATPLKRQTFVSVADMSEMSSRHVGDILLCRTIFWLSASCW
jgi:hypothetical protein